MQTQDVLLIRGNSHKAFCASVRTRPQREIMEPWHWPLASRRRGSAWPIVLSTRSGKGLKSMIHWFCSWACANSAAPAISGLYFDSASAVHTPRHLLYAHIHRKKTHINSSNTCSTSQSDRQHKLALPALGSSQSRSNGKGERERESTSAERAAGSRTPQRCTKRTDTSHGVEGLCEQLLCLWYSIWQDIAELNTFARVSATEGVLSWHWMTPSGS